MLGDEVCAQVSEGRGFCYLGLSRLAAATALLSASKHSLPRRLVADKEHDRCRKKKGPLYVPCCA